MNVAFDFERIFGAPMPADQVTAEIDAMDALCRIPTLPPITTRVVTLNPDLWPSLDGEGDDA